jgi:predicted metal-dependent enzyme (double-stranded beta helix superfamily)
MVEQMTAPVDSPPRPGLAELVAHIRSRARRQADPRTIAKQVADVLVETKPDVDLLTVAERAGSPDGYTRHTLHTEAAFSVSAVVWRPGQVTEIHDHLVWCSFIGVAPPDDIHRVRNTGDTVAITLHVYGADLSRGTSVRRTYEHRDDR